MGRNPNLGPVGVIFLMGSLVMLFFVILSAISNTTPINNTYFLEADTSGISGARPITRWTYFYICGADNTDCSPAWPAPPFGWAWSANPQNAPAQLVGSSGGGTTSTQFFFMWRFGWVFFLIALFFEVIAFLAGFLACCGSLGSAFAGLLSVTALFFYTIAVALMTATFVLARNIFIAANRNATIGTYAFGFSWGSWAALLVATVLFCVSIRGSSYGDRGWRRNRTRSTRSRRSYDMGGRRIKEDYV